MDGIRKWLVAVGASFGVREVHPYRWADAKTRPEVPYMTYTPVEAIPTGAVLRAKPDVDGYDVTNHSVCQAKVTLRIDLYNSAYGLAHLAWVAMAGEKEDAVSNIFHHHQMAYHGLDGAIQEHTESNDERIFYHQSMDVVVTTWLDYAHLNRNHKVDTVDLSGAVSLE